MIGRVLRQLLYPRVCASCESISDRDFPFCSKCAATLQPSGHACCTCCGLPLASPANSSRCGRCVRRPPAFNCARAAFIYRHDDHSSALARAIARFKYGRIPSLAGPLTELLRYGCTLNPSDYDWVAPVPLSLERLRWRGFNQSLLLARPLSSRAHLAPALLERVRATRPQAELGRRERQANVRGAFRVRRDFATRLKGAAILLVDDVMTTGATAHECSVGLRKAGAAHIDVLVLARVALG